jgi:hypothetical protein
VSRVLLYRGCANKGSFGGSLILWRGIERKSVYTIGNREKRNRAVSICEVVEREREKGEKELHGFQIHLYLSVNWLYPSVLPPPIFVSEDIWLIFTGDVASPMNIEVWSKSTRVSYIFVDVTIKLMNITYIHKFCYQWIYFKINSPQNVIPFPIVLAYASLEIGSVHVSCATKLCLLDLTCKKARSVVLILSTPHLSHFVWIFFYLLHLVWANCIFLFEISTWAKYRQNFKLPSHALEMVHEIDTKKSKGSLHGGTRLLNVHESNWNSMAKTCMPRSESPNATPSARSTFMQC